jgi:voltage-gated potassium channel Kch
MPNLKTSGEEFKRLQQRFGDPLLTALTIMLAILMFVVGPMQAAGHVEAHHFGIAFAFVLLAAVFVVSGSALAVSAILIAIALVLAATVLRLRQPSTLDIFLDATAWLIAGLTLGIVVARAVFSPGKVTFHRVIGAVLLYLTIGLVFVSLFSYVALMIPNAFTGLGPLQDNLAVAGNMIYFSFVTLTSVGYGDIVPLHPYARALANVEAIIGQLYPATLLARLVTLELEHRRSP